MSVLLFEKRGHIAYVTLNRPAARNAVNPELVVRLAEAWHEIDADATVRAAIVTGAGETAFCAGADLARLIPLFSGARPVEDEWDRKIIEKRSLVGVALLRDFNPDKPLIAAINGFCIAGGLELVQGTDLRVASESATFALQEVKWAILPSGGSMVRMPRQLPYCKAMEILLTGNRIDAAEAYRLGFVNYVVPPGQVMAKAQELAERIAENGPLAVRAIKRTVLKALGRPLEEGYRMEDEAMREIMRTEDAKEGPRAFIEKRKPRYVGR
jgi:enoyl-CoA hydratase